MHAHTPGPPVRPDVDTRDPEGLWAITSYFNPVGYTRRLENYRVFRRHLAVPLVTVELSFDGRFQLGSGDADILVQIHGGDIMWQKERLLNLAVPRVPPGCDKIAWIDCDVLFETDDWPARTLRALDEHAFVQLFHERYDLPPDVSSADWVSTDQRPPYQSSMYRIATGQARAADLGRRDILVVHRSSPGLGWAGRRGLLESHGFYDACIAGGADRPFICAAFGDFEAGRHALQMNRPRADHYLRWAEPFFEVVRGRVGCISGRIFHLWHGDLADRHYDARFAALTDFDPFTDIALDAQGAWRWNSSKPDVHARLARYFEERMEDGARAR